MFNTLTATTLSGGTIYSGTTNLGSLFTPTIHSHSQYATLSGATFTSTVLGTAISATTLSASTLSLPSLSQGSVIFAGTGGILQQDNANFFWDDTNNWLGVGTATPSTSLHLSSEISVQTTPDVFIDRYSADATAPYIITRKARGTKSIPAAVAANDDIGAFIARGYHSGAAFGTSNVAAVKLIAAEAFTSTAQGTYITFGTTATGSTSRAERMRINDAGLVGIGTTPTYNLHIASTGRAGLYLQADTDNVTETENAFVKMSQDGGGVAGILGTVGNVGFDPENIAYTDTLANAILLGGTTVNENLQFGTNNAVRMTIGTTGRVGIGITAPIGVLNVDVGLSTADISTQVSGTLSFANVSSLIETPAIIGKSNDSTGLFFVGATNDSGNTNSDMQFSVRESNNTDFATTTGIAGFQWRRYTTALMTLNRDGRLGLGLIDQDHVLDIRGTVTTDQISLRSARAAIVANDIIGGINFQSDDTSNAAPGIAVAQFRAVAAVTHTATDLTTDFVWNGTSVLTTAERMRLTGAGLLTAVNAKLTTPTNTTTSVVTIDGTQTLSNKRVTKRVLALSANSATPAINTDLYDVVHITAQTAAITSFTSGLSGSPVDGDMLRISVTGTAAVALTFGASFEDSTVTLPTTTVTTNRLDIGFIWNTESSKWIIVAKA